jgi:hypothetical protein
MSQRLFVELFRSIVNGRRRYLRRRNVNERMAEAASQLAVSVDVFLRAAGPFYADAEVFLQLNEEPDTDL